MHVVFGVAARERCHLCSCRPHQTHRKYNEGIPPSSTVALRSGAVCCCFVVAVVAVRSLRRMCYCFVCLCRCCCWLSREQTVTGLFDHVYAQRCFCNVGCCDRQTCNTNGMRIEVRGVGMFPNVSKSNCVCLDVRRHLCALHSVHASVGSEKCLGRHWSYR